MNATTQHTDLTGASLDARIADLERENGDLRSALRNGFLLVDAPAESFLAAKPWSVHVCSILGVEGVQGFAHVVRPTKGKAMSAETTLYDVRADNGLGGIVIGRDAADTLVTTLGARPDVLTVVATPLGKAAPATPGECVACPACGWDDGGELRIVDWYAEMYPPIPAPRDTLAIWGDDPERDGCLGLAECPECDEPWEVEAMLSAAARVERTMAETLAFLGHGETL